MREIRQIGEPELDEFVRITAEAYPGMKVTTAEDKQKLRERLAVVDADPVCDFFALFEGDEMQGIMRFYHFTMNLLSVKTLCGGVGGVAVDLRHKKKKIARDMILYFLRYYRKKGACLTALYPFRPDFYKQMGFGWGAKMSQYRFKPGGLRPNSLWATAENQAHVAFLTEEDKEAMQACYGRLLDRTNGLFEFPSYVWDGLFKDPAVKVVGYKKEGQLLGYLIFAFEPGQNMLHNHLDLRRLVYDTPEALHNLLAFLKNQADQVDRIIFSTQDETFHHLLHDPRNGNNHLIPPVYHESDVQGIGMMYRVVSVSRLFGVLHEHNFGGQTCRLKMTIRDSFLPENDGSYVVWLENGRSAPQPPHAAYDVEISLDVAEFSSLVTGAVGFKELTSYGLAQISDEQFIGVINRAFAAERPFCMTSF